MRGSVAYFMLLLLPLFFACKASHNAITDNAVVTADESEPVTDTVLEDDLPSYTDDAELFSDTLLDADILSVDEDPSDEEILTGDEVTDADDCLYCADADEDGIPDAIECPEQPCVDSDKDGTPDYLDTDSDGDGVPDEVENEIYPPDRDGDGLPNYLDDDSDGDGFTDAEECPTQLCSDADGDGLPDFLDIDSDNDGLSDAHEREVGTSPVVVDTDEDGTDDFREVVAGCDPLLSDPECTDLITIIFLNYGMSQEQTLRVETVDPMTAGTELWTTVTFEVAAVENEYDINTLDFLTSISPLYAEPAEGSQGNDDTTFYSVVPGTVLFYEMMLKNEVFLHFQKEAIAFTISIHFFGDGTEMFFRNIGIVVPRECLPEDGCE